MVAYHAYRHGDQALFTTEDWTTTFPVGARPERVGAVLLDQRYRSRRGPRFLWQLSPVVAYLAASLPREQVANLYDAEWASAGGYAYRYLPERQLSVHKIGGGHATYYAAEPWFARPLPLVFQQYSVALPRMSYPLHAHGDHLSERESAELLSQLRLLCTGLHAVLALFIGSLRTLPDVGLPRHWYGPGALAARVLPTISQGGVFPRYDESNTNPQLLAALRSSYFGGRIEMLQQGGFPDGVWRYDMHSAYAWALSETPAMEHYWFRFKGNPRRLPVTTLYDVEWRLSDADRFAPGPLPYRYGDGAIAYPQSGRGFYWQPEVERAIRAYGHKRFVVRGGWAHGDSGARPAAGVVARLYAERQRLSVVSSPLADLVRLLLVALYGKLAQRVGEPRYACLPAASYITSLIRCRLLDAMEDNDASIVALATDGVLSTVPLALPLSGDLGGWESERFAGAVMVLPGLYRLRGTDGAYSWGSRGVQATADWWNDALRQLDEGGTLRTTTRLFVTPRLAQLLPTRFGGMDGTIQTLEKTLDPYAYRKRIIDSSMPDVWAPGSRPLRDWVGKSRRTALRSGSLYPSARYDLPEGIIGAATEIELGERLAASLPKVAGHVL